MTHVTHQFMASSLTHDPLTYTIDVARGKNFATIELLELCSLNGLKKYIVADIDICCDRYGIDPKFVRRYWSVFVSSSSYHCIVKTFIVR